MTVFSWTKQESPPPPHPGKKIVNLFPQYEFEPKFFLFGRIGHGPWFQPINWSFHYISCTTWPYKTCIDGTFYFQRKENAERQFPFRDRSINNNNNVSGFQDSSCEIFDQRPDLTFQRLWEVGLCLLTPSQEKWLIKAIEFSILVGKQRLNLNEKNSISLLCLGTRQLSNYLFSPLSLIIG